MREHASYPDTLLKHNDGKDRDGERSGFDAVAKAKAAAKSLQPAKAAS
jgi:hypothetical protein